MTKNLVADATLLETELMAPFDQHAAALRIANYVKKTCLDDDHRKISFDWLIDNGFVNEDDGGPIDIPITSFEGPNLNVGWDSDKCYAAVRNTEDKQGPIMLLEPQTRGQLRLLVRSLGAKP